MKPNCLRCIFLCIEDFGYSDYTVEETQISCLKGRFDNREKAYDFEKEKVEDERGILEKAADGCPFFIKGDPLEMNVDYDCGCGSNGGKFCDDCHETEKKKRLEAKNPANRRPR